MKKLSEHELIDLVALNRILGWSEQVIWGIEDGYHYISDARSCVKVRVSDKNMTALKTLRDKFDGCTPMEGSALRSIMIGKKNTVDIITMDGLKIAMSTEAEIPADDTHIMYETEYGGVVRALYVEDAPHKSYIFLDMAVLECINAANIAKAVKAERTSPVMFTRGDEVACVLPINMHTPAFLAHVN